MGGVYRRPVNNTLEAHERALGGSQAVASCLSEDVFQIKCVGDEGIREARERSIDRPSGGLGASLQSGKQKEGPTTSIRVLQKPR